MSRAPAARRRPRRLLPALPYPHHGRRLRPPAPNRVARDFAAPMLDWLWLGDITYVSAWGGWLYVAVLLDACSRRVVGWALADHLRTELAADALSMALGTRQPPIGCIYHTDRDRQYYRPCYQAILMSSGIVASMPSVGCIVGYTATVGWR